MEELPPLETAVAAGGMNAASQAEAKKQKEAYEAKKKAELISKHVAKAKVTSKLYPHNLAVRYFLELSKKGLLQKMRLQLLERVIACVSSSRKKILQRLYHGPYLRRLRCFVDSAIRTACLHRMMTLIAPNFHTCAPYLPNKLSFNEPRTVRQCFRIHLAPPAAGGSGSRLKAGPCSSRGKDCRPNPSPFTNRGS